MGCRVTILPGTATADEVLAQEPDGVFLSNGPGDPEPLEYAIRTIRGLLGKKPIFGICLGHQLLGLACGAKTFKLKFGHRGANHPVQNLETGAVEITSQNHGFAVAEDSLPNFLQVTHRSLNDGTIEGLSHRDVPAYSVQYHPEASAGPHDSHYLFRRFLESMEAARVASQSVRDSIAASIATSPRLAGQQRDDLDRREDFVRRMIRLVAQRVPHGLGAAQVLLPRFLERAARPVRPTFSARRRRLSPARRGRRRSPRTSDRRAIPAARHRVEFSSVSNVRCGCGQPKPRRS